MHSKVFEDKEEEEKEGGGGGVKLWLGLKFTSHITQRNL